MILAENLGGIEMAAYAYGLLHGGTHFLQAVFANPILGTLSDIRGKKWFLVLSQLGMLTEFVLIAHAPVLSSFVVGAAVKGCTNCFVTIASSAIAELSPPGTTAKNMGLVG